MATRQSSFVVGVEVPRLSFRTLGRCRASRGGDRNVQAVANGLIGGALHLDIQRGVDAQAALVNGFGAVGGFEIFADILEEIRAPDRCADMDV